MRGVAVDDTYTLPLLSTRTRRVESTIIGARNVP